jgi:ATP-binding cassette subfamily B protein
MLRQFFAYYRPWKRLFWLDFGCAVVSGILELAFPLAVTAFIDRLLPQGEWALTLAAGAGLLVIYVVNAGLMAIVTYWGHMLGINIETEMRAKAFDHLTTLSWRWYDKTRTGKLIARVTRDLEEIGEVAHHGPEDLFIAIMTFLGAIALMFWINPHLALLTVLIVPVTVWIVSRYGSRMTATWRTIFSRLGQFNVRLEEALGGIRLVQAFANEAHERRLFDVDNARYREAKLDGYRVMAASQALNYMGMRFVQVVVMVAGAGLVLSGGMTAGGFVGFLLLVNVFFRPLEKIAAVLEVYPKGIAGFQRYLDLLATEPEIADGPDAQPAPALKGAIAFDHVGFFYDEGRPVLHDVTLDVRPGETIAFVGASGAGKTTLLALLPRFYEPTTGRITVDGLPLASMTIESLRRQIGLVSQDVFLFGGTVRENIAYGRLGASDAEIMAAARKAQIADLIAALPDGLDAIVGERGVTLSGGQKQRMAIARAFLKNPPILILDEATSALDSQTEREIQSALEALAVGRTTLVIAHRLGTIRNADRIVVMDRGRIVEQGTHDDLITRAGPYAHLAA